MADDDLRSPYKPSASLLDELESIKGTLSDEIVDRKFTASIPLLDDMVIDNLESHASLLDIGEIFDDDVLDAAATFDTAIEFPRFTLDVAIDDEAKAALPQTQSAVALAEPPRPRVRPDYSREVLIQELIDEFIPQIEIELHQRLQQLSDAALKRLKDSK